MCLVDQQVNDSIWHTIPFSVTVLQLPGSVRIDVLLTRRVYGAHLVTVLYHHKDIPLIVID